MIISKATAAGLVILCTTLFQATTSLELDETFPFVRNLEKSNQGFLKSVLVDAGGDNDTIVTGLGPLRTDRTIKAIANTTDYYSESIFQTARSGDQAFYYKLGGFESGVEAEITLGFAELWDEACIAGKRVQSIFVNGQPFLTNFDVGGSVGGCFKAVLKQGTFNSNEHGEFMIDFVGVVQNPLVNLIEIKTTEQPPVASEPPCGKSNFLGECTMTSQCQDMYSNAYDCKNSEGGVCYCLYNEVCGCLDTATAPVPASVTVPAPVPVPAPVEPPVSAGGTGDILINCGGDAYNDTQGRAWLADQYFTGGNTSADENKTILNTEDDTLYQSERVGECSYEIPLNAGEYFVTLHLAEIIYTAPGMRIFNVSVEGVVVSGVDIVALGGADSATTLDINATVTDGFLSISLDSVPMTDNPTLSAIEIKPGSPTGTVAPTDPAPIPAPVPVPVPVPMPAPVPVPVPVEVISITTESPMASVVPEPCGKNNFAGECTMTSQCQEMYSSAKDCKISDGGVCFCLYDEVCGCLDTATAPVPASVTVPTPVPAPVPSPVPVRAPVPMPVSAPVPAPVEVVSITTESPIETPTAEPTADPSDQPTTAPTTDEPTKSPTRKLSIAPTSEPSPAPITKPTLSPVEPPVAPPVAYPPANLDRKWVYKAPLPIETGEVALAADENYVYLVSGHGTSWANHRKLFRYDPTNDSWKELADQNVVKTTNHAMVQYLDGKIYQIGGHAPETNEVGIYDVATDSWSKGTPLTRNGEKFTLGSSANGIIDGKIYFAGGLHNNNYDGETDTTFVYDPAADSWTELAPMPLPRNHAAGVGYNGKLYVFGGRQGPNGGRPGIANTMIYDVASNSWSMGADIPTLRSGTGNAVELDGELYVIGGENPGPNEIKNAVEAYNPATDTWATYPSMQIPRHGIYPVKLNGDIHVVAGGDDHGFAFSNWHEVFTNKKN